MNQPSPEGVAVLSEVNDKAYNALRHAIDEGRVVAEDPV